ncbi:MAG: formate dehydrogenase subunit alpha [Rhodospirillaceae bacterium]|nr:formate dehydrogenase subunit alpha [Rhodospirillaceae bacterium]|tara:strand:+ start:6091 stop:8919 length:2829 start_codon:yes stop_codon:yes gene_type:complete
MTYFKDLGTPKKKSDKLISAEIDGQKVDIVEGTSILRAAAETGIDIPKLCATDSLEPFGSCRLCLVEVDGVKGMPASCTTPIQDGMKINTQSKKLADIRKGVMELYISDHPLDCLTCSANGDCELQDMAGAVGLREVRYGFEGKNHLSVSKDDSNPYFSFDPSKCIVCSRCVRACEEQQGTFALTIDGRGFDSKVTTGEKEFLDSECVSCGACVNACPTATLIEKTVVQKGIPNRAVETTCAYCGVGCSFTAELQGDDVVRMTPNKNGKANFGHSCVKGRFAWGYATHSDRVKTPLIRESIDKPWTEASWDEAINYVANKFKDIQKESGVDSIGGITSSRCTNEETFLVQKLIRTAFGNNNTDTCARVCHSPTGYGLKTTFGTSAGTQDFESVLDSDLIMVIGANPTDAHPVFASLMKRKLREGAKLIIIDPRKIDLVRTPHVEASYHLQLRPGTNVALINSVAHVIAKENLLDINFINERCEKEEFNNWLKFIIQEKNSPEEMESVTGVPAEIIKKAARLYANSKNSSIYYGLGVTEHSQGTTMVMGMANLAMATGNLGRKGVGVNPLRGQNNVQGACDMGSFPHEFSGYRHVSDDSVRKIFEDYWKVKLDPEPGLRIPNMLDAALDGTFRGIYIQGEDIAQSDPDTKHVMSALSSMDCVVVQDLFLNETAKFAHVFLPGSSFLEKDGTFTNAERRISRVRAAMKPLAGLADWEVTMALSNALGYKMNYDHPSEIMDEIAQLTPTFSGVSYELLDKVGSIQWPCNENAPNGTPIMHVGKFVRGSGLFMITDYIPTDEKTGPRFPLILTTGRVLSQYNVGVQSRRTKNNIWYSEDILEINPFDAESRGINDGDYISLQSRKGATKLKAKFSNKLQPGVVYTTFHHPETEANVITTEFSDWATNCPEYKVTAVEVRLSNYKDEVKLAKKPKDLKSSKSLSQIK